ncbi:MAG: TRAM domain-containing protein [Candidatus Micrarchaeia archaeon]
MKVGDVLDVSIEAVAAKGDGIAKKDGFVIFVPGAKVGETIKVKITDVRMKFAIAAKDEGESGESAPAEEEAAPSEEEASA